MLQETQHIQLLQSPQMTIKHCRGSGNYGLPVLAAMKEISQYLRFIIQKLPLTNHKILKILFILIMISTNITSIQCQKSETKENLNLIQFHSNIIGLQNKVENIRRFNLKEEKNQPNFQFSKSSEKTQKMSTNRRVLQQSKSNQVIQEDPFELDKNIRYVILSNSSKPSYKRVQPQLINGHTLTYVIPFKITKNNQPNQFQNFPSHFYSYSNLSLFRNLTIYRAINYYLNKFYSFSTFDYNSQNDDGYFQNRFHNWNLVQVSSSKNMTNYIYKLVYQMYGNYNTTEEHFTFSYNNQTFDLELINYVKIPQNKRIRHFMKGNENINSLIKGDKKQIGDLNQLLKDIIENRIKQDILYNETLKLFQVTVNEYIPYQPHSKNIFEDLQISQSTNLMRDISIKYYYPVNTSLYYARYYANNLSVQVSYPKEEEPWRYINQQRFYHLATKNSPLEYIEFHYTYNVRTNSLSPQRPTLYPRQRFKTIFSYDYFLNSTISDYIIFKNFANISTQVKVLNNYRSIDRKGVYRTQLEIAPNYNVTFQLNTHIEPLISYQVDDEQKINWIFVVIRPCIDDYQYSQLQIQQFAPEVQFYSIFRRNISEELSNSSAILSPNSSQKSLSQTKLILSHTNNVPQSISQNKNLARLIELLETNTTWQVIQKKYKQMIQPQIQQIQIILQNLGISRQRFSDVKIRQRMIYDIYYCGYVVDFYDKAVNGYARVQMEVSRSRRNDPNQKYNETMLFQNTLFKSHVYQLSENNSKRLSGNYTYVQYFQRSAWPVYLYDRQKKPEKGKQNRAGISIFTNDRQYLQESKNASYNKLTVEGFRQIFVQRVRQYSINNYIYPESLVIVYRNTSQFKDQYPYYMYLVQNQNLNALRSPLHKYLSLQTFAESYAKNQILALSRLMEDVVEKVYNLSVLPISYTVIQPDKQPILKPLLGQYSPTKDQFEQIKEIIYQNLIKTIPLNTKLQIKSIRLMMEGNTNKSLLVITLPMTDRVNEVFYTEIKLYIFKDTKKVYRIQYCKDRFKFESTDIFKQKINPRDKEATIAAQSRILQNLNGTLKEQGIITNKLKSKIRVNPNNQSRRISTGVNPVLVRGKDLFGNTRLFQFFYQLEQITIKITASYAQSVVIQKSRPNLTLVYQLQVRERKVLRNNLRQLQKQQQSYKAEQIKKIKQSEDFKKIHKVLQDFYKYYGEDQIIQDIYIKIWKNSTQYYIRIEILGVKYGINLLYSKVMNRVIMIKMEKYKDQLQFQYVIQEFINEHRLGYQEVIVLKGCRKRKLLQACLECQLGYYLSKDGLCYPSLLFCKVQSGTLCLACQSGYILTSEYQCI